MSPRTRVVITGGGTGGHVFPGIAVARELSKNAEVELLFVGKKEGPEEGWVPSAGFAFEGIRASGFPRRFSRKALAFPGDLWNGFAAADRILARFRPSVVFSTGGYVSFPVCLSAAVRRIPVGLLEPNVRPGLAAKVLAFLSGRIFTGFEGTLAAFPGRKTSWIGIPVRAEIVTAERSKARAGFGLAPDTPTLLMLGGSQGARALNRVMADVVASLGEEGMKVQVILMTGWDDYRKTVEQLQKCGLKAVVRPFIPNIDEAYAAADLVVARSGAMTCAEVTARRLPAVLVPYPHAEGHQEANARALESAGSAVVLLEEGLTAEQLSRTVRSLLGDPARLMEMGEKAVALAKPDAAERIAGDILAMAGAVAGRTRVSSERNGK